MTDVARNHKPVDLRAVPFGSGVLGPADTNPSGDLLSAPVTVVPVRNGQRTIGAYIVSKDSARFKPTTDVTPIAVTTLGVAAVIAVAVALAAAARRPPAIRSVTMGPGGWVSLKGTVLPPLHGPGSPARPWWARALGARRLVVQR
jgi:hypothetical protein